MTGDLQKSTHTPIHTHLLSCSQLRRQPGPFIASRQQLCSGPVHAHPTRPTHQLNRIPCLPPPRPHTFSAALSSAASLALSLPADSSSALALSRPERVTERSASNTTTRWDLNDACSHGQQRKEAVWCEQRGCNVKQAGKVCPQHTIHWDLRTTPAVTKHICKGAGWGVSAPSGWNHGCVRSAPSTTTCWNVNNTYYDTGVRRVESCMSKEGVFPGKAGSGCP